MMNAMIIFLILALLFTAINTAPLHKRIVQVVADSIVQWEEACNASGGGQQCNPLAIAASSTLLAAGGNCDQQNAADNMINLAKTLNNDATMIMLTQIFVQQPRDTPNSLAVPYCDIAPRNPELNGLFQCQFQGANQTSFVGGLQVGAPMTIPFGLLSPVSPLGSCPANPLGPIEDSMQLIDLTQDPGVGSSASSASAVTIAWAASNAPSEAPAVSATSTSTVTPSPSSSPSTPFSDFFSSSSSEVAKWATGICMFIVLLLRGRPKSGVSANEALEVAAEMIEAGEPLSTPLLAQSNSSSPSLSPSNPNSSSNASTLAPPSTLSTDSFSTLSSSVSPNGLRHLNFQPECAPPSPTPLFTQGLGPPITMVFTQCANTHISLGPHTMYGGGNWDKAARLENDRPS